jgi:transcriptional regulator with XRE-family HTH domain
MQSLLKQESLQEKALPEKMSVDRKSEIVAQFTDDVLSKLTGAFFDICAIEKWSKRDLSRISGMNETAIGHILAGRRKNLTVETIALLARAMQARPELVLHDTRPAGNRMPKDLAGGLSFPSRPIAEKPALAPSSAFDRIQAGFRPSDLQGAPASAERSAYAQPELEQAK